MTSIRTIVPPARWWPLVIAVAALAAYHTSFEGAFVLDDRGSILENATIRSLWPLHQPLTPPNNGMPVSGRPLVNLSLAVNYALHGTSVFGYHAVNLGIHLLCALAIFGVVRRTLERMRGPAWDGARAAGAAGAAALLWVVHPLTTAGVTYVSQRAESLASLFIVASLYAFARADASQRPRAWLVASCVACWLGVATKEIAAAAPVLVLAYDRLFVAGSWRELVRGRCGFHAAMAASWLLLAWLIAGTNNRAGTWAADAGIAAGDYMRLQCQALVHYLRLVAWPASLVFDYGRNLPVPRWVEVLPHAMFLGVMAALVLFGLARRAAAAFAGVVFFVVLAPTSSFVPIADAMFEHRMYLASAAVIAVAATAAYRRFGHASWTVLAPLVLVLAWRTDDRNADYRSAVALWADTVEKVPANARAQGNLGSELARVGRHAEAIPRYEESLRLQPGIAEVHNDLAVALDFVGRRTEAIPVYREALRLAPDSVLTQLNLANALAQTGAVAEAIELYTRAVATAPGLAPARTGLARALLRAGRTDEALAQFREATRLSPGDPEVFFNLGEALAQAGRLADATAAFREAVRLKPDYPAALTNLGNTLLLTQRNAEAITAFREALRLAADPKTHTNLGYALLLERRPGEARVQFEAALRLDPGYRPARDGLARLRPPD